jgi:hypothetical protein
MKKILLILLISLISISAQPINKINYEVKIENCDGSGEYQIFSGTMNEGESFIFPSVTLPPEYSSAQFLYNIFATGEFGIPVDALDEDIDLSINLSDFWCNLSYNEDPPGVYQLFSMIVEIVGSNSGYSPLEYYWFQQNKEAFIKLSVDKISFYAAILGIDSLDDIKLFFLNGTEVDENAIRKEIIGNDFIIYPQHFSHLAAGIITGTTDVQLLSDELPNSFELSQNYPNPFNPTTTVNFALPTSGYTKLVVYNALGESMKTLLNEYKSAGSYSIDFNALDLPSGLYFYTLTSGNFTQTKKMILMK